MARLSIPNAPSYYTTKYDNLKGVDFSRDITEVARNRTPTGLNMISDDGGNPIKRLGWRVIQDLQCGKIYEIIFYSDKESEFDNDKIYVIGSNGIYAVVTKDGLQSVVRMLNTTITTAKYFMFNGEVYAFINEGMYKLHGVTASGIDSVYVPENTIQKNPDGSGGTSLESINILTSKRIFTFLGDSTSKDYYLYPSEVREQDLYKYVVKDTLKVEVQTNAGWELAEVTLPEGVEVTAKNEMGELETFMVCEAKFTFAEAKPPLVTGQDNVKVTFQAFDNTSVDGVIKGLYKESRADILSTQCCMTYGYTAVDRVFLVGGIHRNRVYYSDVNEPTYFPDDNYITVGHDSNGVIGLQRISNYLSAIKEDSAIEGTMFLISGAYLNDKMYFSVTATSAGTGALAPKSFATLIDEPLFLSRDGIFAVANYYTTTEKVLRNRSYFLDKRLLKEPNLQSACATIWNRYYILCVNSHCYVLDGRNKANDNRNNTDYLYEAYYWENVPATVFCTNESELFFGTADGKLCKFNTDIGNRTAYCDDGVLVDGALTDGVPICCEWSTPLDDDKRPQYFKNLNKKGTLLTILPAERTSAEVTLIADGDKEFPLGIFYADINTFELIDFERFSFSANETAQDDFFRKKINKYKRLMIKVQNNTLYEPFGILGITKTFTIKNFSKNRG